MLDFVLFSGVVLLWAALAWFIGLYRIERARLERQRGQLAKPVDSVASERITLEPHRLRLRRHAMSYKDMLGDKPWSPPSKTVADEIEKGRQIVQTLEERDPELSRKLQAVARRLGHEQPGGITSGNVTAALEAMDPSTHERLQQLDKRLLGALFKKDEWLQTGEWRPTGSHGRPQRVWVLKAARASAA